MDLEKMNIRLSIGLSENIKLNITMKSKKYQPFVTLVKGFKFDEDDRKVIFSRCEETVLFPNDSEEIKNEEYLTYIKNIKSVDKFTP